MTRDFVFSQLAAHRDELAAFGLRRLALFGSVARNDARADSDVDFLVEFDGPATFDRYVELSQFLESLFPAPIDLVTSGSLRDSLRDCIEQNVLPVTRTEL